MTKTHFFHLKMFSCEQGFLKRDGSSDKPRIKHQYPTCIKLIYNYNEHVIKNNHKVIGRHSPVCHSHSSGLASEPANHIFIHTCKYYFSFTWGLSSNRCNEFDHNHNQQSVSSKSCFRSGLESLIMSVFLEEKKKRLSVNSAKKSR